MSVEAIENGTEVPVTETVEAVVPPVIEQKRYEYQPTDEQGRPMGGRQVILYANPEELASKLTEQNTLLLRKLRAETRKNRLGTVESDTIPDDAARYEEPLTFSPIALTSEQRVALSRNILDPERVDEAANLLMEATLGIKPDKLRKRLAEMDERDLRFQARLESDAFVAANPDYVKCQENFEAITNWMMRYGLAPVKANFQKAHDTLKSAGVLIENYTDSPEPYVAPAAALPTQVESPAPVATPETTIEAPPESAPAPVVEQKTATTPRIPSGFTRDISDDAGAPRSVESDIVYEFAVNGQKKRLTGLAAINAMPADEYKRRVMSDPTFSKKEQQLEKEAAERRRSARR